MLYILAIILPPLAVLIMKRPAQLPLSIILTLCFWVPGVIHAIYLIGQRDVKRPIHCDS